MYGAHTHRYHKVIYVVQGSITFGLPEHQEDVTLRGTNPELDGIRGVVVDSSPVPALGIWYTDNVRIENLSISDSPWVGLGVWYSSVHPKNCWFERNADS